MKYNFTFDIFDIIEIKTALQNELRIWEKGEKLPFAYEIITRIKKLLTELEKREVIEK